MLDITTGSRMTTLNTGKNYLFETLYCYISKNACASFQCVTAQAPAHRTQRPIYHSTHPPARSETLIHACDSDVKVDLYIGTTTIFIRQFNYWLAVWLCKGFKIILATMPYLFSYSGCNRLKSGSNWTFGSGL